MFRLWLPWNFSETYGLLRYCTQVYGGLPPDARRQQAALFNRANRDPHAQQQQQQQQQHHHHTREGDTQQSTSAGAAGAQGNAHGDPGSTDGPDPAHEDPDERLTSWLGSRGDSSSNSSSSSPGSASSSAPPSAPRVLCASDAIGMGLNLHIRRVVFTTMRKFDGRSVRQLQVGGRTRGSLMRAVVEW